jgi:hypothetical protein
VSAAHQLRVRISRAIPRASAAIRVRVSSGRSAAVDATVVAIAVADARIAAAGVLTAVVVAQIVVGAPAADVSNGVGQADPGTTVVIKAVILGHRGARSSFPKC